MMYSKMRTKEVFMLQTDTARQMVNQLLKLPRYSLDSLAKDLGIQEQTLRKLQGAENVYLIPAKQLALIKLYCAKCNHP